ncbi:DNA repair protein RecO [Brackiella oedipodis]|uniref:DNA repair protein RecO n=1 Tax=Brackiella oedipodis TaxID=124225 RepID=UPI00048AA3E1|nr:DNA repair protein RecO [Brackiella oedipodis]
MNKPLAPSHRHFRVSEAPGYLLHAMAWSETSLITRIFTKDHGLQTMVAKGAKRPYSTLRPILLHFQPLLLSWSGKNEVKTLTKAELNGICFLKGRLLMSGWYMNELLLHFLALEDAHPRLYEAYELSLQALAQGEEAEASILRRFEWILLEVCGYGTEQAMPDFKDPQKTVYWRQQLRQRIDRQIDNKPMRTRQVLQSFRDLDIPKIKS